MAPKPTTCKTADPSSASSAVTHTIHGKEAPGRRHRRKADGDAAADRRPTHGPPRPPVPRGQAAAVRGGGRRRRGVIVCPPPPEVPPDAQCSHRLVGGGGRIWGKNILPGDCPPGWVLRGPASDSFKLSNHLQKRHSHAMIACDKICTIFHLGDGCWVSIRKSIRRGDNPSLWRPNQNDHCGTRGSQTESGGLPGIRGARRIFRPRGL